MLFTGETPRSIDDKHRLSLPSEMRVGFATGPAPNIVYAAPGPDAAIWLWPEATFELMAHSSEQSLLPNEDVMDFEQVLYSQSRRIEIDKAGRIRLPEALLRLAGLTDQVVVLGVKDHVELREPNAWEKVREEKLSTLREIMLRARRQFGQGPQGGSH